MGHVSVLAQLYVLAPWVLWFLHSFQPPTCVPLPGSLPPLCLPEVSLFGPPPCFFWGLPLPVWVVGASLSPVWPLSLSAVPPLALSFTLLWTLSSTLSSALFVALSLIALALATLALVALTLSALALSALAFAALTLSDLAFADLALADLVLAVLVEEDHPALQDQRVWADLVLLQDLLVHPDLAYVAGAHQDPWANQA